MSRLPAVPRPAVRAARLESLRRWMDAWACDRALRDAAPAETAPGLQGGAARAGAGSLARDPARDPAPAAGQIRLFHPAVSGRSEGPVFVIVLGESEHGFLVAPFSRFAAPALPGELLTGHQAPPARVVCLWLAATVASALLERSWRVGRAKASELRDALALLRHERDGAAAPAKLADRTGPPLWSVLDPRHDYVVEERERTAFLARGRSIGSLEWDGARVDPEALDKAAEPPEEYGPGRGK